MALTETIRNLKGHIETLKSRLKEANGVPTFWYINEYIYPLFEQFLIIILNQNEEIKQLKEKLGEK